MQTLELFVYDSLLLESNLKKISKNIQIVKEEYAFTYGMIVLIDKRYNFFKARKQNIIFGKLFTLRLSEEDLSLLMINNFYNELTEVEVTPIYNVKNLYTCDFQTYRDKNKYLTVRASTFTSKLGYIRNNRHKTCGNFTKYLLI